MANFERSSRVSLVSDTSTLRSTRYATAGMMLRPSASPAFSSATLSQRMAALFAGGPWTNLATRSDLRLAEGQIAGRKVLVIATDPGAALGTLGVCECDDFQWALQRARATLTPLLLLVDSAGARLNAGLPIQGALRSLMRDLLDARLAGLPVLAVLGSYAFGAASLLVGAAGLRLCSEKSLVSMSGPRVLQAAVPGCASEEVLACIDGRSRSAASASDVLLADELEAYAAAVFSWVAQDVAPPVDADSLQRDAALLKVRLPGWQDVKKEQGSQLTCKLPEGCGAADALRLARRIEAAASAAARSKVALHIRIDCPGHSLKLADEEVFLTQYLVHLALTLRRLTRSGQPVILHIAGRISGGIYIALAAAVSSVELAPGACVQTLPAASLEHILGEQQAGAHTAESHLEWGVADRLEAVAGTTGLQEQQA